ncbi:MAG: AAA family ATPase [Psychromonas sp.]|nr:AAA family ATPase [Psychromonas sp.]
MEKNTLKISPITVKQTDNSSPCLVVQDELNISLPFLMNCLLVCDEQNFAYQLRDYLQGVKNLNIKVEPKITLVDPEIKILLLTYTGNEEQIFSDMEKVQAKNIPVILTGENISPAMMRKIIQYQVNDFIPLESFSEEIAPALLRVAEHISATTKIAPVVSVINGKGGSGASFITDCLGQVYARESEQEIVLFDADFQYGSLANSLDAEPEYYLTDALKEVQDLDALAIKSMMCRNGNVSLLPVKPYSHLLESTQINPYDLSLLINKIRQSYQLLLVDISRGLDIYSQPILEVSDVVLVVVQQNIVSIREAKALVSMMKNRMGIKEERIHLIINRFSKKHSSISVAEIKDAVGIASALVINNNYELASMSTDLGKPLQQIQNSKQIKKDIEQIILDFLPVSMSKKEKPSSFWSRFSFNSNKE